MKLRTAAACCAILTVTSICPLSPKAQEDPAPPPTTQTAPSQRTAERAREFWNKEFAEGKVLLDRGPSALLVSAIEGRTPGIALDIGMGQGRNAVFLATRGYDVTGVDVSDVAVEQARANARARNVRLNAVRSDVDAFDLGKERWDVITSFYMHAWHRRSATDIPTRIYEALRPGGLLAIEGFAEPPNKAGLQTEQLAKQFGRLRIIRNELVAEFPAWYRPERMPLVFFVAEKP